MRINLSVRGKGKRRKRLILVTPSDRVSSNRKLYGYMLIISLRLQCDTCLCAFNFVLQNYQVAEMKGKSLFHSAAVRFVIFRLFIWVERAIYKLTDV